MANRKNPDVIKPRRSLTDKVTAALTGERVSSEKTIFRIPKFADNHGTVIQGTDVIDMMRKYLNADDYRIRVRFRGPRKQGRYSTLRENAEWYAVYIDEKK